MKPHAEAARLAREIRSRLEEFPDANTPALRAIRREISSGIEDSSPEIVFQSALILLEERTDRTRFVVYEVIRYHKATFAMLDTPALLKLGSGLNSWSSVDCFALYLSGPVWREGRVADSVIFAWAHHPDRWLRRTALVSTVPLSRDGLKENVRKVIHVCSRVIADRDDMVVKALSWALRELTKTHPKEVRRFLADHRKALAARVIREVENKLTTGLKTPRRSAG